MEASFLGKKVVVNDEKLSSALYNRSCFGSLVKNKLELSLFEALYLLEKEKLSIYSGRKKLDYSSFLKKALKQDKRFVEQYAVYKDLRERGYIAKTGQKYGSDFRVYEKGCRPGEEHAYFLVSCCYETDPFSWKEFSAAVRLSHGVKKNLLIALVDDESDVTYYRCGWEKL